MSKMPKAVIFDMDGTIVDTEPIASKTFEKIIREYGKIPRPNENGLIQNPGVWGMETYQKLIKEYDLPFEPLALREKRRMYYVDALKNNVQLLPGFLELVNELKRKNIKIGLASNSIQPHVDAIVSEARIQDLFDCISAWNESIQPKPSPDVYLLTAKSLDISPSECVVIEDTYTGVTAGKAAGMKVIAVPSKYTRDQEFSKADIIVNSLLEITIPLLQKIYE